MHSRLAVEKKLSTNELGVNKKSLQNWINATRATERDEFSKIRDLEAEVKFLRKELADSQETVEILKKRLLSSARSKRDFRYHIQAEKGKMIRIPL